jgi:hypothetical protein
MPQKDTSFFNLLRTFIDKIQHILSILFIYLQKKNKMSHNKRPPIPVGYSVNEGTLKKRSQKKFSLPVIGHFANRSVEFKSILEAEKATGIYYGLIFEACIGKIYKAKDVLWEFKKGNHYIKYKAFYINAQENYSQNLEK